MLEKTVLETGTNAGTLFAAPLLSANSPKMSELVPGFLKHGQFDRSVSPETIRKYEECLRMIIRDIGS